MLPGVMPCNFIFVARHLHEDAAPQLRDEQLVVCEPGDRTNRLRTEPKADTHRAGGQGIFSETPRQLDRADHTRAIVIGLHRVTGVSLHKEFACFGVGSAFGVDDRGSDFESQRGIGDEF